MPIDAPGLTIVARPAGRPGEKLEHGEALFSRKYGQSTGVCMFDRVFVPWESVFYAGDWEHSGHLTYSYATHHRHTCIGARAGFGDLLIGAGALMCEANGFDPGKETHLREQMVELIKITEGFFACGVAASVYGKADEHSGIFMPDPVFANIGKLLLATQIYDMHRIAHYVSGGLIVTLPGPDEDHNPETGGQAVRCAARQPGRALRAAHPDRALHRGPDRRLPGRLVQRDQPARRRLAGGDEAGDLAQLSGGLQGGAGRAPAGARRGRTTRSAPSPATASPASAATRAAPRRASR